MATPSLDLNRILSGSLYKGIPDKAVTAIVGPEGTMKSSFMINCAVEAQKKGYTPVLIDTERGINEEFCSRWGLDISKCLYKYIPWVEDIFHLVGSISESGEKVFIGLDSIGGLEGAKLNEDSVKGDVKADQGQLQKKIKRLMKMLLYVAVKNHSFVVITSHLYSQPGHIPLPDTISGGKAVRYLPNLIIQLKKEKIKQGSTSDAPITGNLIKATTLKNRSYPPFQTASVAIDYQKGINPYAGLLEIAIDMGLVDAKGAWFEFPDGSKYQGAANALAGFEENKDILDKIEEVLSTSGYSSQLKNAEELEEAFNEGGSTVDATPEEPPKTKKTKKK